LWREGSTRPPWGFARLPSPSSRARRRWTLSVALEVVPPSSPRSPGVVCYSRSPGSTPTSPLRPGTPTQASLELAPVFPDTPEAGTKAHAPRRSRQPATPSRHHAHLTLSRSGADETVQTFPEQAARRANARNLDPGTSSTPSLSVQLSSVSPLSGSRFSVLDGTPLDHLAQVAEDCGIILAGERGPRLEQIVTIREKIYMRGLWQLPALRRCASGCQSLTLLLPRCRGHQFSAVAVLPHPRPMRLPL
jgi:hypothetical protein